MKLTTEQKISLLVIAGYRPGYIIKSSGFRRKQIEIRIARGEACIFSTYLHWGYHPNFSSGEYDPISWEDARVSDIPDVLIYQAIEY